MKRYRRIGPAGGPAPRETNTLDAEFRLVSIDENKVWRALSSWIGEGERREVRARVGEREILVELHDNARGVAFVGREPFGAQAFPAALATALTCAECSA